MHPLATVPIHSASYVRIHFDHATKQTRGAFVRLPTQHATQSFITKTSRIVKEYIKENSSHWIAFARKTKRLDPDECGGLVLVRGWVKTADWIIGVSNDVETTMAISGGSQKDSVVNVAVSFEVTRHESVLSENDAGVSDSQAAWIAKRKQPAPSSVSILPSSREAPALLKEDQCMFIEDEKVKRRRIIPEVCMVTSRDK